ncbi:MAG: TrbI/VirB10 family protein [Anaplasma sp.]
MSEETKGGGGYDDGMEENVNVVGVHKSKKLFIVLVACAVTGIGYYVFFHSDDAKEQAEEPRQVVEKQENIDKLLKESEVPAQETAPRIMTPPPKLPELPPLVMPSTPELPTLTRISKKKKEEAAPVEVEETKELLPPTVNKKEIEPEPSFDDDMAHNIPMPYGQVGPAPDYSSSSSYGYDRERRGAPMIALGGGATEGGAEASDSSVDSRFKSWDTLEGTSSPSVRATKVGDPGHVILQGHMIDAVLETAINSDMPGVLRAIVSRDVYAEAGNDVMIPKGSRLIGSYFFDGAGNSTRVTVNWSRVILPHGIDIQINSGGTDELGRNGTSGVVDSKVGSALTSTILLAGVSLGTALVTSKIPEVGGEPIKTKTTTGSSTSTTKEGEGSGKTSAAETTTLPVKIVSDAVKDFSESIKSLIKKYSDAKPTIYVDQGTIMKVFVNQDIVFPKDAIRR